LVRVQIDGGDAEARCFAGCRCSFAQDEPSEGEHVVIAVRRGSQLEGLELGGELSPFRYQHDTSAPGELANRFADTIAEPVLADVVERIPSRSADDDVAPRF